MKTLEPRLFRPNAGAWAGEFLLPVVFIALSCYTVISHAGVHPGLALLGLGMLGIIVTTEYLIPMLRSWIQFGRSSIEGSVNGRLFQLYYGEILAAWLIERKRRRYLCLGTKTSTVVFPLYFFNHCAIWGEVSLRLPAEALGNQAVRRLPGYQAGCGETASSTFGQDTPRSVADHWTMQIAGWSGITFALFGAITAVYTRDMQTILLCGGVILACLALLFRWGITEIGPDHIRRSTMFSSYSISWIEVVRIEKDPLGVKLVLVGEGCQLVIPGPSIWSRLGKQHALEMFEGQARLRQIPIQETVLALLKVSRRTRMAH